jgi:hypothetical protein
MSLCGPNFPATALQDFQYLSMNARGYHEDVQGNSTVDRATAIMDAVAGMRHLQLLHLHSIDDAGEQALVGSLSRLNCLRKLHLTRKLVTSLNLAPLSARGSLRCLQFCWNYGATVQLPTCLEALQELDISEFNLLPDEVVRQFGWDECSAALAPVRVFSLTAARRS